MDADKIKDFFVFHFEKMILVVVIGASVFLLYKGFQLPNYLDSHDPDRLIADANQVKTEVDQNHNDAIIPDRIPTLDIVARTADFEKSVNSTPYSMKHLFDPSSSEQVVIRRQDPDLIPPRSLITKGVITAIAVRSSTPDYPLVLLDPADPVEKVEKKPVRRERRRRRGGIAAMDEEMMMMMMEQEESVMEVEQPMESMAGVTRKFNPKYDFSNFSGSAGSLDRYHSRPKMAWFIAGTAVIPHKEMYESYNAAFRDAEDYRPRRDTPFYFNFEVQRADVTDKSVDELAEGDWVRIGNRLLYTL
ncbi:MAG: hypothetical protein MI861_17555, partial [Pirellulales bacterium]|nr:hypothetical protein [Pirellulales bacterium]